MKYLHILLLAVLYHYAYSSLICGGRTYPISSLTWSCCHGKLFHKSWNYNACCNKVCYNPRRQMCCGNELFKKKITSGCCDGKFYERGKQACCNNEVIDSATQDCCRETAYKKSEFVCCNGRLLARDSDMAKTGCCGNKLYDPKNEICCAEQVRQKINKFSTCCKSTVYDSREATCCNGEILNIDPIKDLCCNGVMINSKTDVCCGHGAPRKKSFGSSTGCCRIGKPPVMNDKEVMTDEELSSFAAFNSSSQVCCSGKLNNKIPGDSMACCDQNLYDLDKEICCGSQIFKRTSWKQERCCNGKPYERRRFICCNDKLFKIQSGLSQHTLCCGDNTYDHRHARCKRGGKIVSLQCGADTPSK